MVTTEDKLIMSKTDNIRNVEEIVSGSTTTTYIWEAPRWALNSEQCWKIQKVIEVAGSTTTTTIRWASGSNAANFIWDDRASYTYS